MQLSYRISLKIVYLLFFVFLFNCQKDATEELIIEQHNSLESKFKVQRILFNDLQNDLEFNQISNSFKLQESLQKAKNSTFYKLSSQSEDFTIDFASTKKLTFGKGVSYTFLIERPNQEGFTFENLVIEKLNDNSVKGYILKYESDEYWNESNKEPFKGEVSVSPYAENLNELIDKVNNNSFQKSDDILCGRVHSFSILVEYSCTGNNHALGETCDCGTPAATWCEPAQERIYTFSTYVPCNDFSGSSNIGGDDDGGGGGSGGSFGDLGGGDDGSGSAILGPDGINVPNRDFLVDGLTYAPYASTYADYFSKSWQMFNFLETTNFVQYENPESKPIYQGLKELADVILQNKYTTSKEDFKVLYERQKLIINMLDAVNFDFYALPIEQQKEVARNSLFIAAYPSMKEFGIEFPQNAEEWAEFGEFLITVLKELVPELIPGVAEVISLKNAISAFNSGNYTDGSTELAFAIVGIFPVGKAIKALGKIAKGMKIVVKLSKTFKNAKKMRNAISGSLNNALVWWNKIGIQGNHRRIREIGNSSEAHGRTFFDQLTNNATRIDPPLSGPNPGDYRVLAHMPDGSTIQFRNYSTQSPNSVGTIDFSGGNYNPNEIKELKFNP